VIKKAMKANERWKAGAVGLALATGIVVAAGISGCGTPGAPLPPSLKLPEPVTTLSASRTGNVVSLTWTMPRKTTDKLLIKTETPVRVCRKEGSGACEPVSAYLAFAPNTKATFTEILSAALASGAPRPLTYFVDLNSPRGRSAGPSNGAHVLAGEAPAPVAGLSTQLRKDGVVLHWSAETASNTSTDGTTSAVLIRLHRKLLTPQPNTAAPAKPSSEQGFLAPPKEAIEQSLLVDSAEQAGMAIDKTIRFGRTYEYRAQRVARVLIDGQTVELAGPLSDPIRVEAIDTFPPAVPTGLAAVATAADSAAGASIDLSWLPVAEADLAGYAVYRRECARHHSWQRISPAAAGYWAWLFTILTSSPAMATATPLPPLTSLAMKARALPKLRRLFPIRSRTHRARRNCHDEILPLSAR
jgi:hypothetical protein